MEFEIVYWHWIVFGIFLMLTEIIVPSFTILWFGAGAVIVGAVLWLAPELSMTNQIMLWTISSAAFTIAWFKYLKPLSIDKTKAGLSLESAVGEVGQVLQIPNDSRHGTLRFPAPVLGNDEWLFICKEQDLEVGDRVRVTDVSGNSLIVTKVN